MKHRRSLVLAALSVLALATSHVLPEITTGGSGSGPGSVLISGGGSDPDPFPDWRVLGATNPGRNVLNPGGASRGDAPPRMSTHASTGLPVFVWSLFDGEDFEIAFAMILEDGSWSTIELLTDNDIDDFDPALAVSASGQWTVLWWREEPQGSMLYGRDRVAETDSWTVESAVDAPVRSSRPDVVWHGETIHAVFQRETGDAFGAAVYAKRLDGFLESEVQIDESPYTGPAGDGHLHARLHSEGGKLWADWIHGDGVMAYSVYDEATFTWSPPTFVPYAWGPSLGWTEPIAREMTRATVRRLVIFP